MKRDDCELTESEEERMPVRGCGGTPGKPTTRVVGRDWCPGCEDCAPTRCPRRQCEGVMRSGTAMRSTIRPGAEDFPGVVSTFSEGGPGEHVEVLKCDACGHSVEADCAPVSQNMNRNTGGEPECELYGNQCPQCGRADGWHWKQCYRDPKPPTDAPERMVRAGGGDGEVVPFSEREPAPSLEAEVESLKRAIRRADVVHSEVVDVHIGRVKRAEAEVERLRGALARFGEHREGCAAPFWATDPRCDCGLRAALDDK